VKSKSAKKKLPPATIPSPPVKRKAEKSPAPDYITGLPDHLEMFGGAVFNEHQTCLKLLTDALEEYDDAVYDQVLDGKPKDVLEAMTKGRESILTHVDSILSIACDCAVDHVAGPRTLADTIDEEGEATLGELIGANLSESGSLAQYMFCRSLAGSLSPDAREALLGALLP
jgi:hypothetical protein